MLYLEEPEVIYDYRWIQIVRQQVMESLSGNSGWKAQRTRYFIQIGGQEIAAVPFERIRPITVALDMIVNDAKELGMKQATISVEAERVTGDTPHF